MPVLHEGSEPHGAGEPQVEGEGQRGDHWVFGGRGGRDQGAFLYVITDISTQNEILCGKLSHYNYKLLAYGHMLNILDMN